MKKLISFFLSVVMLVSVVASVDLSAYAATSGDFEYSVSGSNAMITRYTGSSTSVTIPSEIDGYQVTSIGGYAFSGCTSLTSVTIPDSVTSIGISAFKNCTSLTSVTIPNSVTSIGNYAFSRVNNIEYHGSASGSPWGAKSVNGYVDGYLVYRDSTKKELLSCSVQATSVTIPNNVTSIGDYAFAWCSSLTSVTIGDSVTSIGDYAFDDCTSLTNVTIPNSVTSIGECAFYECTSLTSVIIGNSVTSIGGWAFFYCTSLTSVTIPNSVTSIGDCAFDYCTSLTSVTIPDSVTSIGYTAFGNCTSLTNITVSSGNPNYLSDDGVLFNKDKTELIQYPVGNTRTDYNIPFSVTSIGRSAFENCTSLTSVTIPNSVTSIVFYAFSNCTSLTSVTIPDSVTSIGSSAFEYVNNIAYNGSASGSPWGAKSVNGYVDGYLVYKDSTKKELHGCFSQATNVTIPNSVTSIDYSTFYGCTSLTSVTIPDSVTSIRGKAFENCTSLTSVTIPNSVTSIDYYTFYGCTSLTSVTIPNSVTSIGSDAFSYCSSLTSVTIPNSVKSIGENAFYYCTSLSTIYILNKYCNISESYPTIPTSTTIYGLNGSKAQSYANSFSKKFEIINNCNDFGLEHSESYSQNTNVVSSTCTESGSYDVEIRCKNCKTVISCETFITEPLGHSFTNYISNEDATCTENGTKTAKCDRCDETDTITDEGTALGHKYTETEYIAPTSTSNGKIVYTCIRCSDSYTEVIPATGETHTHTWGEWVYNGDAKYVSGSNYTDGTATRTCTECGESETKTIEGTGLLRARTATCEFAGEVRAMLGVRTEQTKLFSNVYCKFTREDGNEIIVNSDKLILSQDETTAYYPFAITPQSLHSDIKVQLYAVTNDGITVWGQEYTYNMANNYIVPQLNKSTDTNWKTLLVELMYYGYENQVQANWKLDQPLTDLLTAEQKALHSTEALTLNKYQNTAYVTCENPETTWRAVNAEFGATTNIVFRTRALTVTDDLKAVVEVEGEAEPYTYYYNDPEDVQYFTSDDVGGIYFKFAELPAKRLRSKIYVTLYKGDTPITNTFEYSAETYCKTQQGKGTQLERITDQLMRYANAARAYFGI